MRKTWSCTALLLQVFCLRLTTAATLPPSLQLASSAHLLSNTSHESVECHARSNFTYPIYDSPLLLDMTFGHRPILSWEMTTFLEYVLIAIKSNAADHPHEYLPHGFFRYHEFGQLGAVTVIPSFYRNFTWSDLYLVLHGLAEYIVKAPRAYEMCVEINFRNGGLAGVIFLDWWTPDTPRTQRHRRVRDFGNHPLLELNF